MNQRIDLMALNNKSDDHQMYYNTSWGRTSMCLTNVFSNPSDVLRYSLKTQTVYLILVPGENSGIQPLGTMNVFLLVSFLRLRGLDFDTEDCMLQFQLTLKDLYWTCPEWPQNSFGVIEFYTSVYKFTLLQ